MTTHLSSWAPDIIGVKKSAIIRISDEQGWTYTVTQDKTSSLKVTIYNLQVFSLHLKTGGDVELLCFYHYEYNYFGCTEWYYFSFSGRSGHHAVLSRWCRREHPSTLWINVWISKPHCSVFLSSSNQTSCGGNDNAWKKTKNQGPTSAINKPYPPTRLHVQCIQKVFRLLHFFHILWCCSLMLKLFKYI